VAHCFGNRRVGGGYTAGLFHSRRDLRAIYAATLLGTPILCLFFDTYLRYISGYLPDWECPRTCANSHPKTLWCPARLPVRFFFVTTHSLC